MTTQGEMFFAPERKIDQEILASLNLKICSEFQETAQAFKDRIKKGTRWYYLGESPRYYFFHYDEVVSVTKDYVEVQTMLEEEVSDHSDIFTDIPLLPYPFRMSHEEYVALYPIQKTFSIPVSTKLEAVTLFETSEEKSERTN